MELIMDDVFKTTGPVADERMIGYEDIYKRLASHAFLTGRSKGVSVSGMNQVGKSSLMKKIVNEAEKNPDRYFSLNIDLARLALDDSKPLMYELIQAVADEVENGWDENESCSEKIMSICTDLLETKEDSQRYRQRFLRLFKLMGRERHTIFIIDEYDSAKDFKQVDEELLRDLMGDEYNVTVFLVSRAKIENIVSVNHCNSTLPSSVTMEYIKGFREEEITEFYNRLENNGVLLSDEDKMIIWYYAGVIPVWYARIGNELVVARETKKIRTVEDVCKQLSHPIYQYYSQVTRRITADKDFDSVFAAVVGPQIGLSRQKLDALETIGYLMKEDNGDSYFSFSPYYSTFLSNLADVEHTSEIEKVLEVEKTLKAIVREQLERYGVFPDNKAAYEKILERSYNLQGKSYDPTRNNNFIQQTKRDYNYEACLLDVVSLSEIVLRFIKQFWSDLFCQYFNGESYARWEERLTTCGKARNPFAHGHPEFLRQDQINEVLAFCETIIQTVSEARPHVDVSALTKPGWMA